MKKKRLLLAMGCVLCISVHAQNVTYNHDEDKMNQFLVGEIGAGTLTPAYY